VCHILRAKVSLDGRARIASLDDVVEASTGCRGRRRLGRGGRRFSGSRGRFGGSWGGLGGRRARCRGTGAVSGAAADRELLANHEDSSILTTRGTKRSVVCYVLGAKISLNRVACISRFDSIVEARTRRSWRRCGSGWSWCRRRRCGHRWRSRFSS
jgi:hypothetical protein